MDLLTKAAANTQPNNCRDCQFSVPDGAEGFACRRFPPTVQVVPVQSLQHGGKLLPQLQSRFPSVSADWFCGEFKLKLAVLN